MTFRGTAVDRDGTISRVEFKSPGSGYRKASGARKWKANVKLTGKRNTILFRAIDSEGKASKIVKARVTLKGR